jgi:sialate O-acetylesterase
MIMTSKPMRPLILAALACFALPAITEAAPLKLHGVFSDHMVIQRDKPITVWGWAQPGKTIHVKFGEETAQAQVAAAAPVEVAGIADQYAGLGRWEVTFPAREANSEPTTLQVTDSQASLQVEDILIGDVWVVYGQSNMAWPLSKTTGSDLARAQANLPLLREFKIKGNEQATLQDDIRPEAVEHGGWLVSTPENAGSYSAIGWHFAANLQRSLEIPIGIINAARGGASIESMVPMHKFADDPIAKRYADHVEQRRAEFDYRAVALETWERQVGRAKSKDKPEAEWPKKPEGYENLRSWDIPGKSPSDRSSVYNGMLGVLKGIHIKGGLFHQGYNNAIAGNCRPKLYRVLTRLMIEGIREDFNDPDLPFCIIGLCAGSTPQNVDDFEMESIDPGAYIRESQRLGLADVENQNNLVFIPGYDIISPGLHPRRKAEHGLRAYRWALAKIYPEPRAQWEAGREDVKMISYEPNGDHFVVKFAGAIIDHDRSQIPEGFSLAGEDGKFYMAHARYAEGKGHPSGFPNEIRVWSPLVPKPVALRYAWARAPMGNLKLGGHPDRPFPSFRTDNWDFPESDDPAVSAVGKAEWNAIKAEAQQRLEFRRTEEAKRGVEIFERIKTLGK